jgi:DNA-binding transcriptional MerR regulator
MPDPSAPGTSAYLSIGEVLGLLLEEFPDVTISKIRFLESQGLIDPERTPSGYRKFYDDDIELLRCILREQRENYLPLKVIKDRLDSGEIDPTNEHPRPRGIANVDGPAPGANGSAQPEEEVGRPPSSAEVRAAHPAAHHSPTPPAPSAPSSPTADAVPTTAVPAAPTLPSAGAGAGSTAAVVPMSAADLCGASGLTETELQGLLRYGLISEPGRSSGYGAEALAIARVAKEFLDAGVEPRHLRGWKVAAEREADLFDQLIQPLIRQRNPDAHARSLDQLRALEAAGGRLRSALVHDALRQHFDG